MTCREYKAGLIEAARGGEEMAARRHAETCSDCAAFLEQQRRLTALMERESAIHAAPPAYLEAQLVREYTGLRSGLRGRAFSRRVAWVATGALAASLAVAWFVRPVPVRIDAATDDPPFLPIPYTQPLAPGERGEVVRMEVPVAALIAAGFPIATSDTGAEASADVIIGEDGRARAVRLISISERSIQR